MWCGGVLACNAVASARTKADNATPPAVQTPPADSTYARVPRIPECRSAHVHGGTPRVLEWEDGAYPICTVHPEQAVGPPHASNKDATVVRVGGPIKVQT